jgi:ribosome-binding factor A
MNPVRQKRLESTMVREISELIIKRRIKDERIGFVSVTRVSLAPDLSEATVFVSLFGPEEEHRDTWRGLTAATGFIQSSLGRSLRLRQTPRITFELDTSIQEGDAILDRIEKGT